MTQSQKEIRVENYIRQNEVSLKLMKIRSAREIFVQVSQDPFVFLNITVKQARSLIHEFAENDQKQIRVKICTKAPFINCVILSAFNTDGTE